MQVIGKLGPYRHSGDGDSMRWLVFTTTLLTLLVAAHLARSSTPTQHAPAVAGLPPLRPETPRNWPPPPFDLHPRRVPPGTVTSENFEGPALHRSSVGLLAGHPAVDEPSLTLPTNARVPLSPIARRSLALVLARANVRTSAAAEAQGSQPTASRDVRSVSPIAPSPAVVVTDLPDSTTSHVSLRPAQPGSDPPSAEADEPVDSRAAQIEQGMIAFDARCTQCHDADRATGKRKGLAGWLATVRKMAAKRDADIPRNEIVPIARYLTSLSYPNSGESIPADNDPAGATGSAFDAVLDSGQFNFSATISTLWRGGNDANTIENPGFFPDVWLSADWQSSGPLSMRVTACTTCHESQHINRLELVEAFAKLDLLKALRGPRAAAARDHGFEANLSAGRVVVPFGAFAGMSHPGVNRTVTNPLMFNMGRTVNPTQIGPVVLPMPYADEGVVLDARLPLACDWSATLDVYAINGLQGFSRIDDFLASRDWLDNNSDPAVGGRLTIGNRFVRLGGSLMTGRLEPDSPAGRVLNYHLAGADVTIRLGRRLRGYLEYAGRRSDYLQGMNRGDEEVYGTVAEVELLVWDRPRVSLLARYDNLVRKSIFQPPVGFKVERLTLGVNLAMPGGSQLMFNYERWQFPDPIRDVNDVLGVRWVATF